VNLLLAATIGVLFGSGAFLLMKPDLFRAVVGVVLVSNAANLTLMASGLGRGDSPIYPLARGTVSDPLVQAMTITAVVIGFGVTALLLSLAYRVYATSRTVDLDELSHAEASHEEELEREEISI
jgi:multicomponent Na+:H+ antiporter subunit C